ncbi:MAG: hypothetical protein F4Z10_08915 [Synechococcus sp. SB0666_bin_14]|nr:hypothetical protein [Synechococcus sp. SB0666_bin_14]
MAGHLKREGAPEGDRGTVRLQGAEGAGILFQDQEQIGQRRGWGQGSGLVFGESVRPAAKELAGFPLAEAKPLPDNADLVRPKRSAGHRYQ